MPRGRHPAPGRESGIPGLRRLLALAAALLTAAAAPAQERADPRALGDDSLRVVYWPAQRALAERVLRVAHAPLPLPGIPEGQAPLTGTVVLAPSPAAFDSITRGRAPGWAAGVAIPSRRIIIVPGYVRENSPVGDPIVALRHEIAHLRLNAYLPGLVPRWFDEGYATWVSGGWDESSAWQIRLAFLLGRGPRLDSLTLDWPRGAADARLAYLLSASAVSHLATRSGEQGFAALMRAWREQGSLDAAIRSTYQMTLGQFEQEWRAVVKRRYGWLLALSQVGAFWLILTLLFLILGSRRRRYTRERFAQLELEDRMLPPPSEEDGLDDPPALK